MTIHSSTLDSKAIGAEIYRISVEPTAGEPSLGTVLALHGLGDHIHCHEEAFKMFCDKGYRVEGFDWPGNGKSAGKRGDIPGVAAAIELLEEFVESMEEKPTAIYAHSTGGFLALPFLANYQPKHPELEWVWLSSPLIRPSHKQPKIKIAISEYLAQRFPELTVPTGVRPSRCFHISDFDVKNIAIHFDNCHSKISARFGRDLLQWESSIIEAATKLENPLKLLITQGDDDKICPLAFAEEVFQSIQIDSKTFLILNNLRHEPLREPENQWFLNSVSEWLDKAISDRKLTNPSNLEKI